MTEAEVVYSNVTFIKTKETPADAETASVPAESTYSEVKVSKTESTTELSGPQQQAVSNGGSKVTSERVAIGILSIVLITAVISLAFTSYKYLQTMDDVHQLKALNTNLTERLLEEKSLNKEEKTCPAFVNTTQRCWNCEEGWKNYQTQCYYFTSDHYQWQQAREDCQQQGGDLVRIDSWDEQNFLVQSLKTKMTTEDDLFWIGLTDSEKEGQWKWVDGSEPDNRLTFWDGYEPNNWDGEDRERGEDCARMGSRVGTRNCWFDRACKIPQKSICEKPARGGYQVCAEI